MMGFQQKVPVVTLAFVFILSSGLNQNVLADDAVSKSSAPTTSFSLEELMLLADVAEKAQKKGSDEEDPANASTFQHRLKQIMQTARVAAGSGQSTGSDILDQTIRQVRARINASGGSGSISDTSIFDTAIKTITRNAGSGTNPVQDSSSLVDTIVQQLSPEASTTPSPPDNSFVGGILRQLANNEGRSGGTGQAFLDAVVKQLAPTATTTTTTTTTTPKPQVLQILDGLFRAYQSRKAPQQDDGQAGNAGSAASSSGAPDPAKLLEGFKSILQQIQGRQGGGGGGGESPAGGQSLTGPQIIEGFISQLKQLQNRGASPGSSDSTGGSSSGGAMPDLSYFQDLLKQFQSRLNPGPASGGSMGPAPPASDVMPPGLEGFEGLITEKPNGASGRVNTPSPGPSTNPGSQQNFAPAATNRPNDAMQILGGFVRQFSESSQQGGNQGAQNFLQGLGKLFGNRGQNMGR